MKDISLALWAITGVLFVLFVGPGRHTTSAPTSSTASSVLATSATSGEDEDIDEGMDGDMLATFEDDDEFLEDMLDAFQDNHR